MNLKKTFLKAIHEQLGTTKNDIQVNNQGKKYISTKMTNLRTFEAKKFNTITKDRVNDRSVTAKVRRRSSSV
uniref:hypothetical protein n=1 Tax=Pseudomonas fluorescens TaxID=294 RepID=UPI00155DAD90|nr:hypothetical protein [Pseudomonas fluorescens]